MNHPLGMGKGKRGADSRRTLGRPPSSEMYSGRRGIPPFSDSPIAPTSPSAVFRSVMSPLSDAPPGGLTIFRINYQYILCKSGVKGWGLWCPRSPERDGMKELRGKVAVVTGGASGIGL